MIKRINIFLAVISLIICSILVLITVLPVFISNNSFLNLINVIKDFFMPLSFDIPMKILSLIPAIILFLFSSITLLKKRDTAIYLWRPLMYFLIFFTIYLINFHFKGQNINFFIYQEIAKRGEILTSIFLILALILEGSIFFLVNEISNKIYFGRKKSENFQRRIVDHKKKERVEVKREEKEETILAESAAIAFPDIPEVKFKSKVPENKLKDPNKTNQMVVEAIENVKSEPEIKKIAGKNTVSLEFFKNVKKEMEAKNKELSYQNQAHAAKESQKSDRPSYIFGSRKELKEQREQRNNFSSNYEDDFEEEVVEPIIEKPSRVERIQPVKEREVLREEILEPIITPKRAEVKQNVAPKKVIEEPKRNHLVTSLNDFKLPPDRILKTYPYKEGRVTTEIQNVSDLIKETLETFRIPVELVDIKVGPTVTLYEYEPDPTVKLTNITSILDNIAMQIRTSYGVRALLPIPGKRAIGFEVPNEIRPTIGFKSLVEDLRNSNKEVPVVLGRDISGKSVILDLATAPHLLVAGATGSGKSVCINSIITSILYTRTPNEVRLILVDPKMVELSIYNDIAHLLTPVITDNKKTVKALEWAIDEMENRYRMLTPLGTRNIKAYNEKIRSEKIAREKMPYIIFIIDEFADVMATTGKDAEGYVTRLAAKARAVGIHLILATQRPSKEVVTGLIKSNMPTKISFRVGTGIDSRVIIDEMGAEKLLGKGDMLLKTALSTTRIQGCFLSDDEVFDVVAHTKRQGKPEYLDESLFEEPVAQEIDFDGDPDDMADEDLYSRAISITVSNNGGSASLLQRKLRIGFARAARFIDRMEDDGILGPSPGGSKPREVIRIPDEYNANI